MPCYSKGNVYYEGDYSRNHATQTDVQKNGKFCHWKEPIDIAIYSNDEV